MRITASKRMWRRRAIKAGWLIGPFLDGLMYALKLPIKLLKEYFKLWRKKPGTAFEISIPLAILVGLLFGFCMFITMIYQDNVLATPAIIQEYARSNACVTEALPIRAATQREPLSLWDVKKTVSRCQKLAEDNAAKKIQEDAMKALK